MANEAKGWQIATSCDVELGKHFQPGQMFEGKILSIDEEAIRTTIQQMDPAISTERQELLFNAADMLGDRLTHASGISAGLFHRHNKTGVMEIHVAVNHISWSATLSHVFRSKTPSSSHPAKPEEVQGTAIHELRHAVDFADESTRSKLEKEDEMTRGDLFHVIGYMAMRKITYMALGGSAGIYSSSLVTGRRPVEIASALVGAVAGSAAARPGREKAIKETVKGIRLHKYMRKSTAEKRARASAQQAHHHQQIVYIN